MECLGELICSRQPEEESALGDLHRRYLEASPPRKGEQASLAYRLRLLFLDRWNLWPRLTRYRTWQGPQGQNVDGTNNGSERAIGWWIKERYRSMRGYKRPQSAVNVSRLLAWAGNHLHQGGADLAYLSPEKQQKVGGIRLSDSRASLLPNFERSRGLPKRAFTANSATPKN